MTEPSKMKVNELKAELQSRGLDVSGKKADLLKRLIEAMDEEEEPEEAPKPKRGAAKKAAAPKKAAKGRKRAKEEEEEEEEEEEAAPKKPAAKKAKKSQAPVDKACPLSGSAKVYEDYDVMLNQTNIGGNNNKYYIIQLIENGSSYYVWTHWGRVGENGQNALNNCGGDLNKALKEFKKKFTDKTKNKWEDRENFTPVSGKYTIVEIDHSEGADEEMEEIEAAASTVKRKRAPCQLDKTTQELVKTIFSHDMFKTAMADMEIDTQKLPLGKLTQGQVKKGHDVLSDLSKELEKARPSSAKINELSSRFYTLIPHNFGRSVPPPINRAEALQRKIDLLNTLSDIEHAQSLLKKTKDEGGDLDKEIPHELDQNYATLKNDMRLLNKKSDEFKMLDTYCRNTSGGYFKCSIQEAWELDRAGEYERMEEHEDIEYRKLLWHGTSVAVVVAILSSGLRIMPHSGGRVGRGIYHASEQSKSAGYTGRVPGTRIGYMFLNEVAMGKMKHITKDDSSLRCAPKGYDSVLAVGRQEPDPAQNITVDGPWGEIEVPQGKPINQAEGKNSSFSQSEYLVYRESQVRMRYLLKIQF